MSDATKTSGRTPDDAGAGALPSRARFERAKGLARRRRFDEAGVELDAALDAGGCTPAEALDLRARIRAQQGMLLEAEAAWVEALRLDPGEARYADALSALRRTHDPYRLARARLLAWVAIALAAAALLAAYAAYRETRTGGARVAARLEALEHASAAAARRLEALPGADAVDERMQRLREAFESGLAAARTAAEQRDARRAAQAARDQSELLRAIGEGAARRERNDTPGPAKGAAGGRSPQ